jgi:hypothetical protein
MRKHIAPLMLLSVMAISPLAISQAQDASTTPAVTTAAPSYFIALNGLRVRSTPEDSGKTMGLLSLNEKVRIVNPELINGKYVQIEIVATVNKMQPSDKYYVLREYLSDKIIDYKEFTGKYFVVVNVATETIRVYERQCLDNSCPAKMLMESEVVVGEDKDHPKEEKGKGRSILGSYRVTGWAKFYQDPDGHYPAWYRDGYPALPGIGENAWHEWFKKEVMPLDAAGKREGKMRGAFGWYAAFVSPNPFGQWTHGTLGWGADHDTYIKKTKKGLLNIISDPRSSGCTRNNNEAIAFIRQLVDTGTPIVKVYAKEALLDPALSNYREETKEWNYILTKRAAEKSDREEVLKALGVSGADADNFWAAKRNGGQLILDPKSPLNNILEVGTYTLDAQPTPIAYTPGERMTKFSRSIGRKGNVYGIKSNDMYGTFYVDAGVLENYHHPKTVLEVSGFEDEETPPWMNATNLNK